MTALDIFALILVIILAWCLEWIMVNIIFIGSQGKDGQDELVGHSKAKANRESGVLSKPTNRIQEDQVARGKSRLYT